jgi:signal transduction histidine kinase
VSDPNAASKLRGLHRVLGPAWGVRNLVGIGDPDSLDNRERVVRLAAMFGMSLGMIAIVVSGLNIFFNRTAPGYRPVPVMLVCGAGTIGAAVIVPFARRLPLWFVHVGAMGVNLSLMLTALFAGVFSIYALIAYIPGVTVIGMICNRKALVFHLLFVSTAAGVVFAVQPGNSSPVSRWLVFTGVCIVSGGVAAWLVERLGDFARREYEARRDAEAARAELEIVSRHKSAFLANMSHELRTPLNAIIGFSDLLDQGVGGDLARKQHEYVADIRASGRHLLSLINDVLDLAKVEAGKDELEISRFQLADALLEGVRIMRDRADGAGVALSASLQPGIGWIDADERKVRQIVLNLLSNAVKFTPRGGMVDLRALQRDDHVEVSVRDTGVGISPDDQARIFDEFTRAENAGSEEGTGLGLALAQRFVELHGGKIWVDSDIGRGSTFRFTLPLHPSVSAQ